MSVSMSHPLWVWTFIALLFCFVLSFGLHVAVPDLAIALFAGLTILFLFVTTGPSNPPT